MQYSMYTLCIPVKIRQMVEHTYTVYFHSLVLLQIMELSPFIGFGLPPLAQTWYFDYNMSFTKIRLCSKYFDWVRGGGGADL